MAFVDKRGGEVNHTIYPSSGFREDYIYTDLNDVPVDITGYVFTFTMSDDEARSSYSRSSQPTQTVYELTIDDAVNGAMSLYISPSAFAELWGEEAVYGITVQQPNGDPLPFVWGTLTFEDSK